ncbi:aromatic ring-hydroxylating oxygenase subunit alpha [Ramlibacter albus]|uniref:Rieske 2Fe-2S domain-containing protein n=1 Tax=Ramlibacter albus TaxID=2079448 RepID=A0A923S0X3_9BURK|nr:SRPBCC family protein [Ramlibacter albus]MBC5763043.1 Rieske 2Fe-2S domain-containing protein [Ramlibacter albus]
MKSRIDGLVQDGGPPGRFLVERSIFTDHDVFDREMAAIFEGGWVYLAHESQLPQPDDFVNVSLGRRSVIVARGGDGVVRAFLNACPHRGSALVRTAAGNRRMLTCPYHGWSFDSSGKNRLVKGRETGAYSEAFDAADVDLKALSHVQVYRGFVFGALANNVAPLDQHLGEAKFFIDLLVDQAPDGLEVVAGSAAYRFHGNWKLQVENGVDAYHFPVVHNNYVRILQQRQIRAQKSGIHDNVRTGFDQKAWGKEAGWHDLGQGHMLLWLVSAAPSDRPLWEQRDALAERVGPDRARWMVERQRNLSLFPNVQLMDQNSTQIRVIVPLAPDLTEVRSYCFAPRGEPAAAREKRVRQFEDFFNASGFATPDDLAVFEQVQRGCETAPEIRHGYDRGATRAGVQKQGDDAQDETMYHGFYRRWLAAMQEGE